MEGVCILRLQLGDCPAVVSAAGSKHRTGTAVQPFNSLYAAFAALQLCTGWSASTETVLILDLLYEVTIETLFVD